MWKNAFYLYHEAANMFTANMFSMSSKIMIYIYLQFKGKVVGSS